jgi:hypothetical protein
MEYSEMTTNVLVAFYSTYGHVHRMALAVAEGAESVPDCTVRLRRIAELEEARKALSAQDAYVRAQQAQADIPEVTDDDLRWADGIAWGTPPANPSTITAATHEKAALKFFRRRRRETFTGRALSTTKRMVMFFGRSRVRPSTKTNTDDRRTSAGAVPIGLTPILSS